MYDTFHEPFKRVVPARTSVPETPAKACPVNEAKDDESELDGGSKSKMKEPELTVKSALSAAFAKYTEKVGEKTNKKTKREKSDGVAEEAKAKNMTSNENASSSCLPTKR